MPGGVNSPVRAFRGVGGTPRFIERGSGALLTDVDGNEYVDYMLSWGALVLGHAHRAVVDAIRAQAERGTSYGAPTELETELAELITGAMPGVEMVRLVSSGTEAVMSAVRLARAATRRSLIMKFDGCYHGHSDGMLVSAGSGIATLGLPDSPGVTRGAVADTVSIPFNNLSAVEELFSARGKEVAAVLVEPIAGNMGMVPPADEYLPALRKIAAKHGALLIFDEVMTGFRVAHGGAQSLFGVDPDITCFGKVIGGGLPVGAYGGRRELMEHIAPAGSVYQAGTLSGNPLAMAAGIATLRQLDKPNVYADLGKTSRKLAEGIGNTARKHGMTLQTASVGGMWGFFFSANPVIDYASAKQSDTKAFSRFFHSCLAEGVYLAPSQFESCFVSTVHDDAVVERTLAAFERSFAKLSD